MDLYLLRHGIAVERGAYNGSDDAERPLSADGKRKMKRIAKAMHAAGLRFDAIITSPYLRSRATAEIVASVLEKETVELSDALEPGGDAAALVAALARRAASLHAVLLVGHEPSLSDLAGTLLTDHAGLPLRLRKGGLLKLRVSKLRYGTCATLEWLLPPRLLSRMA